MSYADTIVAQATPIGRGGIGILRISGPATKTVAKAILGKLPRARYAEYLPFQDPQDGILDQGIALYFPAPHSFTGEDVLELQGHGGPIILDLLIRAVLKLPDVRIARPGEFSERAFLNDKLDLAQAEAIADLIDANTEKAARYALHSLKGTFSLLINELVESLTHLRIYIEASMDFPDEEINFLSDGKIAAKLDTVIHDLEKVRDQAHQGQLLREGMKIVIAGRPNAGKSSLLNALTGKEVAIVTDVPGTTRDVLREQIEINGMPLNIIDTAGLRDTEDHVEKIGIERAWNEIDQADRVLLIVDGSISLEKDQFWQEWERRSPLTVVRNKADITGEAIALTETKETTFISLSAKTGEGIELLREHLQQKMGFTGNIEGKFLSRRRHLEAMKTAMEHLILAKQNLSNGDFLPELLAEELRLAQKSLSEITGQLSSNDLLGKIFSSFCIGK